MSMARLDESMVNMIMDNISNNTVIVVMGDRIIRGQYIAKKLSDDISEVLSMESVIRLQKDLKMDDFNTNKPLIIVLPLRDAEHRKKTLKLLNNATNKNKIGINISYSESYINMTYNKGYLTGNLNFDDYTTRGEDLKYYISSSELLKKDEGFDIVFTQTENGYTYER